MLEWPDHRPDINRPYGVEWAALLEDGETISTSNWTVPDGVTNPGSEKGIIGTKTYVRVTGGSMGVHYTFTNTITTSLGNTQQCQIDLFVEPR